MTDDATVTDEPTDAPVTDEARHWAAIRVDPWGQPVLAPCESALAASHWDDRLWRRL